MDRPVSLLTGALNHHPDFSCFTGQELPFTQASHHLTFQYEEVSLVSLCGLAQRLGVRNISMKDESKRFGLNVLKGLGTSSATAWFLWEDLGCTGASDHAVLTTPGARERVCDRIFVTAIDESHDKSVVWTAPVFGCRTGVYMPKGSKEGRIQATRAISDTLVEATRLNCDDAVRLATKWAKENGQTLVQDIGTAGYVKTLHDIALGYITMASEILEQMRVQGEVASIHAFLQAGVGSMAGGALVYLEQKLTADPPYTAIVESDTVVCIFESVEVSGGNPIATGGNSEMIMAGLNCGEPNPFTRPVLHDFALCYAARLDRVTELGMRTLVYPHNGDGKMISGESGAMGLGLLVHLYLAPGMHAERQRMGLGENAIVSLSSTEDNASPKVYHRIVETAGNK